ncbi:nuclease-related domain-containing protein [Roseospira visakhapatnamensis]|uniref:NERD domain-containing protein n=1 Tax=Roseospira visakhapatnamensis TaxID=390880 RepID=A0A7W6RDR6_9PROT|nr:nuclease-related domain-containing protein [Roseospira visakhapatnamensis]MBB4266694.1 hypothetical protein [Roseospira visakhapatnamensis]
MKGPLWWLLVWVVAISLVMSGLYMTLGPWLRHGGAQRRVARALRRAGLPALNDVVLPGARGVLCQVDHVVRLPTGFVVLEAVMRGGRLVGGPRGNTWRQDLGLERYHFGNPLKRLDESMEAVRRALPDKGEDGTRTPALTGQVVVPRNTRFPRGRPDGVSPLDEFMDELRAAARTAPPPNTRVTEAWEALRVASLAAPGGVWGFLRRTLRQVMADERGRGGLMALVVGGFLTLVMLSQS